MPEHEQDDRLAVRVGLRHRRGKPGPGHEPAEAGAGRRAGGRGGRRRHRGGAGAWRSRADARARRRRGAGGVRRCRAAGVAWRSPSSRCRSCATTLVIEQEGDDHHQDAEHGDLGDRVVVQGLPHEAGPAAGGRRQAAKNEGPNLPAPLGLRTLLRRWASTGGPQRDSPETDSQADCAGSQLERLSNKFEPCVTIAVTGDSTGEPAKAWSDRVARANRLPINRAAGAGSPAREAAPRPPAPARR